MPVWYYEKKDLKNSPSTVSGLPYEDEIRYRREGARFIQELGKALGLRHDTMATAAVYFHRFYMFHSFIEFPRYVTATCALFLAGKAEETPKKCKDIIKNVRDLLNPAQFSTFGADPREEVMTLERVLLQTIKFDLQVDHPYSSLIRYAKCLKGDKAKLQKMVQMSWTFVNDSLCTTLCLQWEPEVIAIALMYLAAKLSKFEVKDWEARTPKHRHWWDQYVKYLETDVLEDICHQVLDLYTTPATNAKDAPPSPPPGSRPPPPPPPLGPPVAATPTKPPPQQPPVKPQPPPSQPPALPSPFATTTYTAPKALMPYPGSSGPTPPPYPSYAHAAAAAPPPPPAPYPSYAAPPPHSYPPALSSARLPPVNGPPPSSDYRLPPSGPPPSMHHPPPPTDLHRGPPPDIRSAPPPPAPPSAHMSVASEIHVRSYASVQDYRAVSAGLPPADHNLRPGGSGSLMSSSPAMANRGAPPLESPSAYSHRGPPPPPSHDVRNLHTSAAPPPPITSHPPPSSGDQQRAGYPPYQHHRGGGGVNMSAPLREPSMMGRSSWGGGPAPSAGAMSTPPPPPRGLQPPPGSSSGPFTRRGGSGNNGRPGPYSRHSTGGRDY